MLKKNSLLIDANILNIAYIFSSQYLMITHTTHSFKQFTQKKIDEKSESGREINRCGKVRLPFVHSLRCRIRICKERDKAENASLVNTKRV